jgi:hypothetical protein
MTKETEQRVEYRNSTGYYSEPLSERYDRELQGTALGKAPAMTTEQRFAQSQVGLDPWQPSVVPETRRHLIGGVGSSHQGGHYVGGNVGIHTGRR